MRKVTHPSTRFWNKVRKTDTCWVWTGKTNRTGYGQILYGRHGCQKSMFAHRLSYEIHYGRIPEGMCICHHCDNPPCVNPSHLFIGTRADNMADKMAKGRQRRKLTDAQVVFVKEQKWRSAMTRQQLADSLGVTLGTIKQILSGQNYKRINVPIVKMMGRNQFDYLSRDAALSLRSS